MRQRVDAAVPMDAQNAPTGTWKTAQNAVSHSAHTHHSFVRREKSKEPDHASHTEILTLPPTETAKLVNPSTSRTKRTSELLVNPANLGTSREPCEPRNFS
jgi:hypothetical protein